MTSLDPVVAREAARRRTFAIISHPDAGKTTLTEKLLLYGGCIETAGAVRGRKNQRGATSDWMAARTPTRDFCEFYRSCIRIRGLSDQSAGHARAQRLQ